MAEFEISQTLFGVSGLIDEANLMSITLTREENLISEHRRAIEVGEWVESAKFRAIFHKLGNFRHRTIGLPPSARTPNFSSHNILVHTFEDSLFPLIRGVFSEQIVLVGTWPPFCLWVACPIFAQMVEKTLDTLGSKPSVIDGRPCSGK